MKQKIIFFGNDGKQIQKILSLFGVYTFQTEKEPESFFEFKNHFLKEKTQFIFLEGGLENKFKKKIETYFNENYESLNKVRTSISFLKFNYKRNRWYLEAIKI